MGATATIPPELAALVERLAELQAGAVSIQLAELATLLAPAKNVRPLPPQTFTPGYLVLTDTLPHQIVGRRIDRAKVVVVNLDTTATDWVWVASSMDRVAQDSTAYPLLGAGVELSRVTLESQDDVWVRAKTADTAVAWLIYDYNAG